MTNIEIAEAVSTILAPHGNHPWASCAAHDSVLCDECIMDSAIATAAAAERERLKSLVLTFCRGRMPGRQFDQLAQLFKAPHD